MQPLGIDHVGLTVHDLDTALEFYVGLLGLRVRDDRPEFPVAGAWLDAGGQQVHLIVADKEPGSATHFALRVGNLDAVIGELRGAGVDVSDAMAVAASRQAFTTDPFGNSIELHQRPLRARRPDVVRIPPAEREDAPPTDVQRELFTRLADDGALNVRMTVAQNPGVAQGFRALATELARTSRLSKRTRELVILRTAWRAQSVYEWSQHQLTAPDAGIDTEELRALARELELSSWNADDRVVLAAVDELCTLDCITDATWSELAARFDEPTLVEITFLVGMYRMLAGFLNSAGVALDEGLAGWPAQEPAAPLPA